MRIRWTSKEDAALEAGIREFGKGRWSAISKKYPFLIKTHPSPSALKDRARILEQHKTMAPKTPMAGPAVCDMRNAAGLDVCGMRNAAVNTASDTGVIYGIFVGPAIYIGQTTNFFGRMAGHKSDVKRGRGSGVHRYIRAHPEWSAHVEVLEMCPVSELLKAEDRWISAMLHGEMLIVLNGV